MASETVVVSATNSLHFSQNSWTKGDWDTWDQIRKKGQPLQKASKYASFLTLEVGETDPLVWIIRAAIQVDYSEVNTKEFVWYLCPKWEQGPVRYDELWARINDWLEPLLDKEKGAAALKGLAKIFGDEQIKNFQLSGYDLRTVRSLRTHQEFLNREGVPCWFALFRYPTKGLVRWPGEITEYFKTYPDSVILLARVLASLYQFALRQVAGTLAVKAAKSAARAADKEAEQRRLQFVSNCFFNAKGPRYKLQWRWEEVEKGTKQLVKSEEEEKEEKESKDSLEQIYNAFAKDKDFTKFLWNNFRNLAQGLGYSFATDAAAAIPGIGPIIQVAIAATDIKGAIKETVNSSAAEQRATLLETLTKECTKVQKLKQSISSSSTIAGMELTALCVQDLAETSRKDALQEMGVSVSAAMLALAPGIPAAVPASGKLAFRFYGFLASVRAEYLALKSWQALVDDGPNRQPTAVMSAFKDFDWMKGVVVRRALAKGKKAGKSSGQKPVDQSISVLGEEAAEYLEIAAELEKLNKDISETKEAVEAEWPFFGSSLFHVGRRENWSLPAMR